MAHIEIIIGFKEMRIEERLELRAPYVD